MIKVGDTVHYKKSIFPRIYTIVGKVVDIKDGKADVIKTSGLKAGREWVHLSRLSIKKG
jgi:hypothetical protein